MKKRRIRILSFLLLTVTLFSVLPPSALESFAYNHSASTPLPSGEYKSWKQFDSRWTDQVIGTYEWYDKNGNYHLYNTVGHAGCYISSIAMLCRAHGLTFSDGSEINPGSFGKRLYNNGSCTYLTGDGSMYSAYTWCNTMIPGVEYATTNWFTSESRSSIATLIAKYLNDKTYEYGVVVGVSGHFVAVDYVSGNNVYICDPGYYDRTELFSSYSKVYRIIVFKFNSKATPTTTYQVSYHANGGTLAPSTQTKKKGESITLREETPTRVGYSFLGWATTAGGSVSYQPGAKYGADASLTLYAVWKERTDCEVWKLSASNSLNIRSGPGTSYSVITALPPSSEIAVTEIKIASDHIWAKIDEGWCALDYCTHVRGSLYRLNYDANGGTGTLSSQAFPYSCTVKITAAVPTRENYDFLGWAKTKDAASAVYTSASSVVNTAASDLTLYAVWLRKGYNITFHANGGKNTPAVQRKPYGEAVALSSAVPTRVGYTFLGWATKKDASQVEYRGGDQISADGNLTLYAVWTPEIYTVKFDANGGDRTPESFKKTYGVEVKLPETVLSRHDYLFLGWSTDPDAEQATYFPGDSYRKEGNTTLYAVWKPYSYLITFDANGGSKAPEAVCKIKNTDLTLPMQKPQRAGFIFLGWATDPNAASPEYQIGEILKKNGELTLYAVWGQDCYLLSFDANGGTDAPSDQVKEQDTVLTLSNQIPTREGYTFLGWASDPNADVEEFLAGGTYDLEGETTLFAVWSKNSYYLTVTYLFEDGSEAAPMVTEQIPYLDKYEIVSPLLAMTTPDAYVISGTVTEKADYVVTYYFADREYRPLLLTGIGEVSADSLTVTGCSYPGGGVLFYGVSETDRAEDVISWQSEPTVTGLTQGKDYYVFAKIVHDTYYEDAVSDPVLIHAADPETDEDSDIPANVTTPIGNFTPEEVEITLHLTLPFVLIGAGLALVLLALILLRRLTVSVEKY